MLIATNPWRAIMIGLLGAGWLVLVAPLTAQEAASVAPAEITAAAATETGTEMDATTDQVTTTSISPPAIDPQTTATKINTLGINSLLAATNAPSPDPRAGDTPGWWFETALKQRGEYPEFLGIRFAEASRAVIIETPNRKLTTGQPLVYRLWVCNDLPQAMVCRVEHAVRQGEIVISHTNVLNFMIEGSKARLAGRFKQSTDALAPGTCTIDATLRDQTGNLLHHTKETVEFTAP